MHVNRIRPARWRASKRHLRPRSQTAVASNVSFKEIAVSPSAYQVQWSQQHACAAPAKDAGVSVTGVQHRHTTRPAPRHDLDTCKLWFQECKQGLSPEGMHWCRYQEPRSAGQKVCQSHGGAHSPARGSQWQHRLSLGPCWCSSAQRYSLTLHQQPVSASMDAPIQRLRTPAASRHAHLDKVMCSKPRLLQTSISGGSHTSWKHIQTDV
jgi:hypothetical protein